MGIPDYVFVVRNRSSATHNLYDFTATHNKKMVRNNKFTDEQAWSEISTRPVGNQRREFKCKYLFL